MRFWKTFLGCSRGAQSCRKVINNCGTILLPILGLSQHPGYQNRGVERTKSFIYFFSEDAFSVDKCFPAFYNLDRKWECLQITLTLVAGSEEPAANGLLSCPEGTRDISLMPPFVELLCHNNGSWDNIIFSPFFWG